MLRIEQIVTYLASQTEITEAEHSFVVSELKTRRFAAEGTSFWVDQDYQATLTVSNLHKTRAYPAWCLALFDWFEQEGHPGESFTHLATETDALHYQLVVHLHLTEYLEWSLLTPAEELSIPSDERIHYQGTDYKQTERTALIGL